MNITTDNTAELLHSTTDAQVWAKEFVRIFPEFAKHEGLMHSWFANAIETGKTHMYQLLTTKIEVQDTK